MSAGRMTDAEKTLIESVKRGDRRSFDTLVHIHRQEGLNVAYNLVGNLEDAKDVLQEAFIKVYLNIRNFHGESQFATWFYRIVTNSALNFLRKRKRSQHIFNGPILDKEGEEKPLEVADERYQPRKTAMANEVNNMIEDSLGKLSEKQKTCFILKHKNGLSIEEISHIVKCNPSTVKVHIFRAVNNLRKVLSRPI